MTAMVENKPTKIVHRMMSGTRLHAEFIVLRLSALSAHQVQSDSNPQTTLIRVGLIDAKVCVRDAIGGAGRQDFS
jgi:hypothetical protein